MPVQASSHDLTFTPWLKAKRSLTPRLALQSSAPDAEWMTCVSSWKRCRSEGPCYNQPSPQGVTARVSCSDGGHHAVTGRRIRRHRAEHVPAMLCVQPLCRTDRKAALQRPLPVTKSPFDTFNYPHRPLYAMANWPFGVKEEEPEKTMPKFKSDTH